jgi:hypothetical protein
VQLNNYTKIVWKTESILGSGISDCDQFHWGDSCSNTCDCGPGASSCNPLTGCVCMSGWQGNKCDADVDECNDVNNL